MSTGFNLEAFSGVSKNAHAFRAKHKTLQYKQHSVNKGNLLHAKVHYLHQFYYISVPNWVPCALINWVEFGDYCISILVTDWFR